MRELAPFYGHLCHMPSHISVLTGKYAESIKSNKIGYEADQKYFEYRLTNGLPKMCVYFLYQCHNLHFIVYSAFFQGNYNEAIHYARELLK